MHAPQITVIALWVLGVGVALGKHGQPRTGEWSVWANLIGTGIYAGVLYWGGFFG